MSALNRPSTSENSDTPYARRKSTKRITSPTDDDASVTSAPAFKRPRLDASDDESEASRQSARAPAASSSRAKPKSAPKKKRSKVVISDPESEEFDPVDDESEPEMPLEDDDDEYMSEPKNTGKRAGGGKGKAAKGGKAKKKLESKEIMAKDEGKRRADSSEAAGAPTAKRARTKAIPKSGGDIVVDVIGEAPPAPVDTPPLREDAGPVIPKKKLPQIKKNKAPAAGSGVSAPAASGAANATPSIPHKAAPPVARGDEDSKLPPPVVGTGARKAAVPLSADVDLSNPTMYAQLFKSGGGSTPAGSSRREKEEERRKELNRMRDEARAKRINEAPPLFDLQGQMDKIAGFEQRLRNSRSPAVYPNFIAGGLKQFHSDPKREAREEGEM
ncbi:hypothetical protein C8R47DRAFT_352026 [Mycena vitilis]|nr:hypothetical protein C8R47DRAFT_352026 [Mycena vitilis]